MSCFFNKTIIFWSYKCGCTYIRDVYYNLYLNLNYKKNTIKIITLLNRYNSLDYIKLAHYRKVYICRDPYSRLVSCFIDKYINGHFSFYFKLNIKIKNIFNYFHNKSFIKNSFKEFVNLVYDKFILSKYTLLEFDHIAPQFSINYNRNIIFDRIYKLEDLDNSTFLKDEFNIIKQSKDEFNIIKQSKDEFKQSKDEFKQSKDEFNIIKQSKDEFNSIKQSNPSKDSHNNNCSNSEYYIYNAYDLTYEELLKLKKNKMIPNYKCFYNEDIIYKIYEIYKNDFIIFSDYNINYII